MKSLAKIGDDIAAFGEEADGFIRDAHELLADEMQVSENPDQFWLKLPVKLQEQSLKLQKEILTLVGELVPHVKRSSLTSEADERDLSRCAKEIRAALRLRSYRSWDTDILHDEDIVLGVRPAGQSEAEAATPYYASRALHRGADKLFELWELVSVAPEVDQALPQQLISESAKYRPGTVFVMMRIDPSDPELEDVYDVIKSCCTGFGLTAIRADEIEHEEVITEKILFEIRTSEFLIADLTGERPSVYYEIGYAHSLKRRVIMYRRKGTPVHFDLAAYNCPEYNNLTDLRSRLTRRLQDVTNRTGHEA